MRLKLLVLLGALAGIILNGAVNAADVITVRWKNQMGASVGPEPQTSCSGLSPCPYPSTIPHSTSSTTNWTNTVSGPSGQGIFRYGAFFSGTKKSCQVIVSMDPEPGTCGFSSPVAFRTDGTGFVCSASVASQTGTPGTCTQVVDVMMGP
jgi:hypothetical protein